MFLCNCWMCLIYDNVAFATCFRYSQKAKNKKSFAYRIATVCFADTIISEMLTEMNL